MIQIINTTAPIFGAWEWRTSQFSSWLLPQQVGECCVLPLGFVEPVQLHLIIGLPLTALLGPVMKMIHYCTAWGRKVYTSQGVSLPLSPCALVWNAEPNRGVNRSLLVILTWVLWCTHPCVYVTDLFPVSWRTGDVQNPMVWADVQSSSIWNWMLLTCASPMSTAELQ